MLLPQSVSSSVDKIARAALGRDWSLYAVLFNHWAEIVGPDYASRTSPVKISFPKGKQAEEKWAQGHRTDGILVVKVPQGLMMEFTYKSEQIKQRLTSFFGYCAIEKIVCEPFYETKSAVRETRPLTGQEKKDLHDKLKDIDDPALRERLESFGQTLLSQGIKNDE